MCSDSSYSNTSYVFMGQISWIIHHWYILMIWWSLYGFILWYCRTTRIIYQTINWRWLHLDCVCGWLRGLVFSNTPKIMLTCLWVTLFSVWSKRLMLDFCIGLTWLCNQKQCFHKIAEICNLVAMAFRLN